MFKGFPKWEEITGCNYFHPLSSSAACKTTILITLAHTHIERDRERDLHTITNHRLWEDKILS
jgi:hypothetical protein